MHIRKDVVYNKHDGSVVGFVDIRDINNHLQRFEHLINGKQSRIQHPAKSMFTIMVRGLFTKFYAHFLCVNLTGEQITPLFWEAVYRVERCELKVVGATFDGAVPNRRFLQLQDTGPKPILHKVTNPYAGPEKREIFRPSTLNQNCTELLVFLSTTSVGKKKYYSIHACVSCK